MNPPLKNATPLDLNKFNPSTRSGDHSVVHTVLMGAIALFLIVLGVLGYMLYMKQSQKTMVITTPPVVVKPTATPTPTLTEDQEVENIDVGNVDNDISPIKQDLNQL